MNDEILLTLRHHEWNLILSRSALAWYKSRSVKPPMIPLGGLLNVALMGVRSVARNSEINSLPGQDLNAVISNKQEAQKLAREDVRLSLAPSGEMHVFRPDGSRVAEVSIFESDLEKIRKVWPELNVAHESTISGGKVGPDRDSLVEVPKLSIGSGVNQAVVDEVRKAMAPDEDLLAVHH